MNSSENFSYETKSNNLLSEPSQYILITFWLINILKINSQRLLQLSILIWINMSLVPKRTSNDIYDNSLIFHKEIPILARLVLDLFKLLLTCVKKFITFSSEQ
jgi:hypothetical protein